MTMMIVAAVLFVLLVATMYLLQREKKNSSLAWQAVRDLDQRLERTKDVSNAAFEEAKDAVKAAIDIAEEVRKLRSRVKELESGVVPGFEEAKAAVKAVNDFNVGLSAIMGYDPMAALKKSRDREGEAE